MPEFLVGEHNIKRYRQTLYLLPPQSGTAVQPRQRIWHLSESLKIEELGLVLEPRFLIGPESEVSERALNENDTVEVRFRRGGELLRMSQGGPSKTLKNLFQEHGLPPWQRDRVPLIYYQEKLIGVWGFTIARSEYLG